RARARDAAARALRDRPPRQRRPPARERPAHPRAARRPMTTPCQCGCGSVVPGTCGCCEGIHPATPRPVVNRPYLDALSYRVGTHESFLATMLARLSGREFPTLHELAARTGDDAAIALLDAWATVGDVLTFYQDRIANEGYLRTATERRSVLEAARLVGYELRPGVAASTYLA